VDAKAHAICHDRKSDGLIHVKAILRDLLCSGTAAAALLLAPWAFGAGGHTPKVGSSSSSGSDNSLPTGRGALRQIVQTQCVLGWKQHANPAPCERVSLYDPNVSDVGYAVLQDPAGGAHYLLVPTQTMAGLESSELLDRDAPNYFAEAWRVHDLLSKSIGHPVPRTDIGLVVNTERTRAYDQFHIHLECLRQDAADALRAASSTISDTWGPVNVGGATSDAGHIASDSLDGSNLYESVATLKPGVAQRLRDYTLVAVGAQFVSGPGFILLTGTGPTGEILMDSTCEVAGGGG
jgi:CDP-diacylglycerol pyrophosphatase